MVGKGGSPLPHRKPSGTTLEGGAVEGEKAKVYILIEGCSFKAGK